MIVETTVYKVAERHPTVDDEEWYEYSVALVHEGVTLDKWDSLVETYNNVEAQRLTQAEARMAAEDIKKEVEEDGKADEWFDFEHPGEEKRDGKFVIYNESSEIGDGDPIIAHARDGDGGKNIISLGTGFNNHSDLERQLAHAVDTGKPSTNISRENACKLEMAQEVTIFLPNSHYTAPKPER